MEIASTNFRLRLCRFRSRSDYMQYPGGAHQLYDRKAFYPGDSVRRPHLRQERARSVSRRIRCFIREFVRNPSADRKEIGLHEHAVLYVQGDMTLVSGKLRPLVPGNAFLETVFFACGRWCLSSIHCAVPASSRIHFVLWCRESLHSRSISSACMCVCVLSDETLAWTNPTPGGSTPPRGERHRLYR